LQMRIVDDAVGAKPTVGMQKAANLRPQQPLLR
jgi:hypothetical protein